MGTMAMGQASYRFEMYNLLVRQSTNLLWQPVEHEAIFSIATSDGGLLTGARVINNSPGAQSHNELLLTKSTLWGEVEWSWLYHDIQSTSEDVAPAYAVEAPGKGYWLVGNIQHQNNPSEPQAAYVCFIDPDGHVQWGSEMYTNIGAIEHQTIEKALRNDADQLVAVGSKQTTSNGVKGYVAIFDHNGSHLLSEQDDYSSLHLEYVDIAHASSGNCISVAYAGQRLVLVHRTNDCWDVDWVSTMTQTQTMRPQAVTFDPDTEGFFVVGSYLDWPQPGRRGFIAYADDSGAFQWFKAVTGPNDNVVLKDVVVWDGDAYVVGNGFANSPSGAKEGFIAKFDVNGNLHWSENFEPTGIPNEQLLLSSIELWHDPQNPTQAKYFQMGGTAHPTASTNFENIALHLAEVGTWDDQCNTNNYALNVTNVTFTSPNYGITTTTLNDWHNFEFDIVQWEDFKDKHCGNLKTRPIEADLEAESGFRAGPNPTAGNIFLEIPDDQLPATFSITDMRGQRVATGKLEGTQTQIQLEGAENGIYFLNILGKSVSYTRKVVLTR